MKGYLRFALWGILLIGVCIIAIGGGIYLFRGNSSTSPPVSMMRHHLALPGDNKAEVLPTIPPGEQSSGVGQSGSHAVGAGNPSGNASASLPGLPPTPNP